MKTLDYYLEYEQPTNYIVDSDFYDSSYDVPVLTAGQSFILGYTNEKNNIFPSDKLPVIIFDDFTTSTQFVDFPFKVKSSAMKILHPTKNANIKYFYYYLKSIKKNTETHKRYWISEYSKLLVPDITIQEQTEIVENLDLINNAIDNRKQAIEDLNKLIESSFVNIFGSMLKNEKKWNIKKIKEICLKVTDGKHGGCKSEKNSGYFFIGATEINNKKINYKNANQITKEDFEKDYARCDLKVGDLLIVNTGATIGKTAIAVDEELTNKTLLQKSVALLRPNNKEVLSKFLQYCYICNEHLYNKGQGCARKNLLISQIKDTDIFVPPLEVQEKFILLVEQIENQIKMYEDDINDLEHLLKIKMLEYFN